jgi:GR25 family glycosyltransferase involved in LPS biosynthesis
MYYNIIAEKYERALIFEDDVILSHNFIDKSFLIVLFKVLICYPIF